MLQDNLWSFLRTFVLCVVVMMCFSSVNLIMRAYIEQSTLQERIRSEGLIVQEQYKVYAACVRHKQPVQCRHILKEFGWVDDSLKQQPKKKVKKKKSKKKKSSVQQILRRYR